MSHIQITDDALSRMLYKVAAKMQRPRELTAAISVSFLAITDDNFDMQGRPAWAGLSAAYLKVRKQGKILSQSGQLRDSIQTFHSDTEAGLSSNLPYSAIHQFGGTIKHPGGTRYQVIGSGMAVFVSNAFSGPTTGVTKAHDILMPARPYLPMDADGNLQAEASAAIYDDVDFFYRKLFD